MTLTPGSPQAPATANRATMREFVAVLFRRRWLILGLFLVVTATVVLVTLTTPTYYSSSGRVLVTRGERESALSGRVQILNEWEQDLAGEVAKVRSDTVLAHARVLLDARAKVGGRKPPGLAANRVDVQVSGKSNVLEIGYDDLNPEVAQEVCDALLTSYVEYRREKGWARSDSMFAAAMDTLDRQIQERLAEREHISATSGVSDPMEQMRAWNSSSLGIEQRRNEVAADLADAKAVLEQLRQFQQHPDRDVAGSSALPTGDEGSLFPIKMKITDQQAVVARLRERYRDDSPEVQRAAETLETLQALLRREIDSRLAVSQARVEALQARLAVHDRDLAALRAKLASVPQNQRSIEDLNAEIKTLRGRYDEYAKARDLARITKNTSEGVTVTLLNPAGAAKPKNTRDIVRMLLAPAFSLVVGTGLAFFFDGLDLTVRTAGQAEEYLELPVLATLPERRRQRG